MVDVLIVGAGGAGLTAALHANAAGARVKVLCKSYPTSAQTGMAQGGINAALAHMEVDSPQIHIEDTLKSAQGLASRAAVEKLCREGVKMVEWLDSIGVPFSRNDESYISQRRLGGATHARACYAQDYTGLKILHTLFDQCLKAGIDFDNERFLLNLMRADSGEVCGVTALNIATGCVERHDAHAVVLATGGYAKLYGRHSTNARGTTGDGVAAALRAGARLSDMEFVQFHPTALLHSGILISESARGAGGYLLSAKGERFTDERGTRDVVARAIRDEIEHGGGAVYLDIRHLGQAFIDEELPQERKLARLYEGVDPVHEIIPIKPVAHYTMGGIAVDDASQSTLSGLFACGECANHRVHGANRLGGNSLLELIVFGKQAGESAAAYAVKKRVACTDERQFLSDQNFVQGVKYFTNQIDFYQKREMMGNIFYNNAGIVRSDMGLKAVLGAIRQMQREVPFMGPRDKSKAYNTNLLEFIEFGNMVELAEVVLVSAISRVESRGAHYREDAPKPHDAMFRAHTHTWKEDGVLCADFVGE
ncbi:MAG: FAD-dependent oxidoreductase [Campylobacterales bacterium]|nr:FAD-dependent oxidoreductase [Campylobacterales bacterium]